MCVCVHMHTGYDSCPFTGLHTYTALNSILKWSSSLSLCTYAMAIENERVWKYTKEIFYCKDGLDFVAVSLIKHTHISHEEIELRNR